MVETATIEYVDFDIEIRPLDDGFEASVSKTPVGYAYTRFAAPVSASDLNQAVVDLGHTRGDAEDQHNIGRKARDFGTKLYEALFSGDMKTSFLRSLDRAREERQGLRIRLHLRRVPELANIPWEYLYSEELGAFLALCPDTPVIRHPDLPMETKALTISPPLRILVMISSPIDARKLEVEKEWRRLEECLRPAIDDGQIELTLVETATLSELRRLSRTGAFHVFHFIGHGAFDEEQQMGTLVFEDHEERSRWVDGSDLGTILLGNRSLRLAVLNACVGARGSAIDPFASVALALSRQGLPAVVAMQFAVTDEAAVAFASEFYTAVAAGRPVDTALTEARRALLAIDTDVEWGTPVLYLRAPDGRLFDMVGAPPPTLLPTVGVAPEAPSQPDDVSMDRSRAPPRWKGRGWVIVAGLAVVLALAIGLVVSLAGDDAPVVSEEAPPVTATTVADVVAPVEPEITPEEPTEVALPPNVVGVPDVIGLDAGIAIDVLQRADLASRIVMESSFDVPEGMVSRTEPQAGPSVPPGSVVYVYVSDGPPFVPQPEVDVADRSGPILPNTRMDPGFSHRSENGMYALEFQADGNLVLYAGDVALWATGTNGTGADRAIMQADGNLVVYEPGGEAVWASDTAGNADAILHVQNDGNLVIYSSSGQVLWASNTVQ